jgi:hypothetical protein
MNQRHKYADLIIAWANGAKIQCRRHGQCDWSDCYTPTWRRGYEYRIKPEPKPDVELFCRITLHDGFGSGWSDTEWACDNVKVTFDGETSKLKSIEVLK